MARAKGSNPPETQFNYQDADGTNHYFGDLWRSVFGGGSISPRDPEEDIFTQSRRGERPTQQGEGTSEQEDYRKYFKSCTMLWNSLPVECPEGYFDPMPTSKQSVFAAKDDFGVVCSYYDLFMRCCIKWALANAGEMPDGDCFPCEYVCKDDLAWDYSVSAETINANDSCTIAISCGDPGPFNWAVSGTDFSLGNAQTTGLTNSLIAGPNACGSASVTVSAVICPGVVTGYVRGTEGQWTYITNLCLLSGASGSVSNVAFGNFDVTAIQGNKKQVINYDYYGWSQAGSTIPIFFRGDDGQANAIAACQDIMEARCEIPTKCLSFSVDCGVVGAPNWLKNCGQDNDICRAVCQAFVHRYYDDGWKLEYYGASSVLSFRDPIGSRQSYYEWRCIP